MANINMCSTSDSESDYFIDKSDISDAEDLPDYLSEDENGGSEPDSCDVQPYLFEPEAYESDIEGELTVSLVTTDRRTDLSWCRCGNCLAMATEDECTCCQEIAEVTNQLDELKTHGYSEEEIPNCIMLHLGFSSVCTDIWLLRAAYLAYRQQFGDRNDTQQQRYRFTAYRQLVRFCWGYLGKDVRVIIPACAVTVIRNTFPSDTYKGFALPKIDV